MNITLKTEYALRALHEVIVTGTEKPVSRKQIASNQKISENFLEKILISLQKKKIISSVRGPGGGFLLNREPHEITLWDVFIAVDDIDYSDERCFPKTNNCCNMGEHCGVKKIWFKFNQTLKHAMNEITLDEMLDKHIPRTEENSKL